MIGLLTDSLEDSFCFLLCGVGFMYNEPPFHDYTVRRGWLYTVHDVLGVPRQWSKFNVHLVVDLMNL